MTVSERVAYIRGLYDGLGLNVNPSGEARILSEMLDVLREMGLRLDGMDAAMDMFDKDLAALENAVSGDGDEDSPDGDPSLIPCPSCGKDLTVDGSALAAKVLICPACGGRFALSFEDGQNPGRSK